MESRLKKMVGETSGSRCLGRSQLTLLPGLDARYSSKPHRVR